MARMKIQVISFTDCGSRLNAELCGKLENYGYACEGYAPERFAGEHGLHVVEHDLRAWIGARWGSCGFLFIGAAGIAVRMIAPWVKDKLTDSPVVAVDEKGKFAIPLLSCHMGGAAGIARDVAECTGGVPVVTTATDVQGKFAVDVFARDNHLLLTDRGLAKRISAAVLGGERVGLYHAAGEIAKLSGVPPKEIEVCEDGRESDGFRYGIRIAQSLELQPRKDRILTMLLGNLIVGIGCRRGMDCADLREGLCGVLERRGLLPGQIAAIVSIDLKRDEEGLIRLADELDVPFLTYPADELRKVREVSSSSAFVEQVTGVDNVCERAVLCCRRDVRLIREKVCLEGMTVAVGALPVEIHLLAQTESRVQDLRASLEL